MLLVSTRSLLTSSSRLSIRIHPSKTYSFQNLSTVSKATPTIVARSIHNRLTSRTQSPIDASIATARTLSSTRTMSTASQISATMKAILIKDGKGPSENLYFGQAPVPQLEDDQVLVKIKAFGLNRMDLVQRVGQYPLPPGTSEIMGVEFSGTVVAVNNLKSASFNLGQEVFGLATGGAYAEYIRVPASMVFEKPKELDWVQAASIPENYITAYQALRTIANLQHGENVLIHAGASGVGLAAIQLAKAFGANKVYITAGTQQKVEFCQQIGADKGFNYKTQDWAHELATETSAPSPSAGSVDVIVDFVGAPYHAKNIDSLKRDGRMVLLAFLGGAVAKDINLSQILFKRLRIEGSTLRSRSLEYQGQLVQDFIRERGLERIISSCSGADDDHHHKLVIHKIYSWKDIKDAHDEMEANQNIGKIVVTID